jgi:hypothetical protein
LETLVEASFFLVCFALVLRVFSGTWGLGGVFNIRASTSSRELPPGDFGMAKPDFYGPRLKLERAEKHIKELKSAFDAYVAENMERMNPKTNQGVQGAVGPGFPKDTPTILGDALHNLRACLDHAWCALIQANDGKPLDKSNFPIHRGDRQSVKGSIDGHKASKAAPSDKVIAYILDEAQPYIGGKLNLLDLHTLDIADKHVVLLPTKVVFSTSDAPLTIHNPDGGTTVFSGIDFAGDLSKHPGFAFIAGGRHEYTGDPHSAFEINFGEGQPLEGKPILPALQGFVAAIRKMLDDLEGLT